MEPAELLRRQIAHSDVDFRVSGGEAENELEKSKSGTT